jgi:hypothetical protein
MCQSTTLTLVNVSGLESEVVVVQASHFEDELDKSGHVILACDLEMDINFSEASTLSNHDYNCLIDRT